MVSTDKIAARNKGYKAQKWSEILPAYLSILLALSWVLNLPICAQNQEESTKFESDEHYKLGRSYLEQGMLMEAEREFAKLAELYQDSEQVYKALGILFYENRFYKKAIEKLEAARKLNPYSYEISYNLALAYFMDRRYDAAIRILKGIDNNSRTAKYYGLLAATLAKKGEISQAINQMKMALRIDPDPDFVYSLGLTFLEDYRVGEAINLFQEGAVQFPSSPKIYHGLGLAYHIGKRYAKAQDAFKRAIALKPDYAQAYFSLGNSYQESGDPKAAIDAYQKAIELDPDDHLALYHYATVLIKQQQEVQAADLLKKAIKLNPRYANAHYELGKIYLKREMYSEAITHLKRAVQINPDLAEAHFQLGNAYIRLGDVERAKAEFQTFERLLESEREKARGSKSAYGFKPPN